MKDLLFFESMLTPKIITIVYWFLLLVAVVSGLGTMFSGQFIGGILVLVGGMLGARIWCELLIVLFKSNENIKKIANGQA